MGAQFYGKNLCKFYSFFTPNRIVICNNMSMQAFNTVAHR
jgi:hypothetical protein